MNNRRRLVYFERWFNPVAEENRGAQDDIELLRLRFFDSEATNWAALATACGYQISARTELSEPWFGNAALLSRYPMLLAISVPGAGYDVVDVDACTAAGVIVCHQGGTNSEAVAEHAMALMLSLLKRVGIANRALLKGAAADRQSFSGHDIRGKTVGIIGIGNIRRLTARYCQAFGMRVLAYDPYLTAEQISQRNATKVEFATVLAEADFISVHCPRTQDTIGMFGAAEFSRMKNGTYFINTARGLIHDEEALIESLSAGKLAGAGIDVFAVEPPPADHPLLHFDTVIATPHIAGITYESNHDMAKGAAEQWIGLLRGRVPPRLVNPSAWPAYAERFARIVGFAPDPLDEHAD